MKRPGNKQQACNLKADTVTPLAPSQLGQFHNKEAKPNKKEVLVGISHCVVTTEVLTWRERKKNQQQPLC